MMTEISADGRAAANFIQRWHGPACLPTDWVTLIMLNADPALGKPRPGEPDDRRKVKRTQSSGYKLGELVNALQTGDLDRLSLLKGAHWNLYTNAALLKERPSGGRRGGKRSVAGAPGGWLDLDVKPGSFDSTDHVFRTLDSITHQPTIINLTGSGGIHAYWRTAGRLQPDQAEDLNKRLWAHVSQISGVQVDRTHNADRIMRLPGSIRWPKPDETHEPTLAETLSDNGPVFQLESLQTMCADAWVVQLKEYARKRSALKRESWKAAAALRVVFADEDMSMIELMAHVENEFNEMYTWDQILSACGWTCDRDDDGEPEVDDEGRQSWTRPGGVTRSASVGYVGSPHVMSLFSTNTKTGLLELRDADVPLTKYRVWVQLKWDGDEVAFVKEFASTMRRPA